MPLKDPFAYVVCYNLKETPDHYLGLFDELKKSYRWWHYMDSTWIVLRHDALAELGPKLRALIYKSDRLLIMPAKGPADGWLPGDAWAWINDHVPREW